MNLKDNLKIYNKAFSLVEISVVILVIGILIAGISAGVDLYRDSKLIVAQNLTRNSIVARTPDLGMWLEVTNKSFENANNSSDIKDGERIVKWVANNNSNAKIVALQSNTDEQPIFVKRGINNLPAMYFDATSQSSGKSLTIPYNPDLNTRYFTIFLVVQPMIPKSSYMWHSMVMQSSSTPPSGYNIMLRKESMMPFNTHEWSINTWSNTMGTTALVGLDDIKVSSPHIITIDCNSSTLKVFYNGLTYYSNSCLMTPNPNGPLNIGKNYDSFNNYNSMYYRGYISEIIYFKNGLDIQRMKEVQSYLSKKYEIKVSDYN